MENKKVKSSHDRLLSKLLSDVTYLQAELRVMHMRMHMFYISLMDNKEIKDFTDLPSSMSQDSINIDKMVQPIYEELYKNMMDVVEVHDEKPDE